LRDQDLAGSSDDGAEPGIASVGRRGRLVPQRSRSSDAWVLNRTITPKSGSADTSHRDNSNQQCDQRESAAGPSRSPTPRGGRRRHRAYLGSVPQADHLTGVGTLALGCRRHHRNDGPARPAAAPTVTNRYPIYANLRWRRASAAALSPPSCSPPRYTSRHRTDGRRDHHLAYAVVRDAAVRVQPDRGVGHRRHDFWYVW
jgi:hypothetical protein